MKVSLINHDSSASVKIAAYDPNGDMKAPLDEQLLMPNQGTEPKELQLTAGRCYLLTISEDSNSAGQRLVINPDSQQNMLVREREDVAVADQPLTNKEDKIMRDTAGPTEDPTIVHLPAVEPSSLEQTRMDQEQATRDAVQAAKDKAAKR